MRVFTVALVPTGMKTGVSTAPCGVCSSPARAPVAHAAIQAVGADGVNEMIGLQDDTVRPRMNRRFGLAVYGNAQKAAKCCDTDKK